MTPVTMRKRLSAFLCADSGSATVEFTLWVPAFLAILLLGADASSAFLKHSNFWRVSHETARIVSRHALDAEGGATFARDRLRIGSYVPEIAVTIDDAQQTVTVSVIADSKELAAFGILSLVLGDQISFSVSQTLEPT